MSKEPIQIYEMGRKEAVKVLLPDGIGYVEIRTGNVHGPTGFPVVGVDVESKATQRPARDGLLYTPYRDRESGVVLVGKPGPQMLERQRQVAWVEMVFALHNSGDHSECPDTCPAKES